MLAARQVADLRRIISFGFDETSKYQVGMLSTNIQGEMADGRTADKVMRGAFVIAGGAVKHVVNAEQFNDVKTSGDGAGEEGGPQPRALAMYRLDRSLLMSDTCNAARATKRQLAAVVKAAVQAEIGEAA
eukprot:1061487-Pleurochrysis_carterae.AAC.1